MSVKYPNYVNLTSSSEEQPNERTPSPPPRKKSLSPPQAPSKSISRKSTHYTSSLSPKLYGEYIVEAVRGNGKTTKLLKIPPTLVRRNCHQSVEYKRLLGEVFSLTVGKGFIDGLFVGQKDEDIQTILKATPGVDPTSSDTFMEEYNKLFDQRYPYVDKVARAYLLDPTGLQNVMPDGTGPTPGQGPRDTPTTSYD
ncbi:hypothetical protein Tco_0317124 [Tanacetum coccineum]